MIGLVPAEKLVEYVGQEIGSSDWFEVDQDRIDMFADATLDHQFIHIDSEKATPFIWLNYSTWIPISIIGTTFNFASSAWHLKT